MGSNWNMNESPGSEPGPVSDRRSDRDSERGSAASFDFEVDAAETGSRLDAILARRLGLSSRATRRLIGDGNVTVNGHPAAKGAFPARGDRIASRVKDRDADTRGAAGNPHDTPDLLPTPPEDVPCLLETRSFTDAPALSDACAPRDSDRDVTERFAFLHKPRFLHSVTLAGRDNPSLEDRLPELLPRHPNARLLQRLDFGTSGIVSVGLDDDAEELFRRLERGLFVTKDYCCLLEGVLEEETPVTNRLVPDGGRRVRALEESDPDPARRTVFTPLRVGNVTDFLPCPTGASVPDRLQGLPVTLAQATIHRGFRHQIRVHASSLGHPLLFDALYGGTPPPPGGGFHLHHWRLRLEFPDRRLVVVDRKSPVFADLVPEGDIR